MIVSTKLSTTQMLVVMEVAERHRGKDTQQQYLRKLARTCKDMIDGKPVRKWRLDRLLEFSNDLGETTLRMVASPGCGTIRL